MSQHRQITSHSEISTLAACEWKWQERYMFGAPSDTSPAMYLGTVMHHLVAEWWEQGKWGTFFTEMVEAEGGDMNEEPWLTAAYLMWRYTEHYEHLRDSVRAVDHEVDVTVKLPRFGSYRAILDALWETPLGLWVVERKTYGRNTRLDTVLVDPQLTMNVWAAREAGYPVVGVVFDGIYTYRYKGVRPTSDSFEMLWLDRTDDHIAEALLEVDGALQRRRRLRAGGRPLRNIGPACSWCPVRGACHEALSFPNEIKLVTE